MTIRSVLQFQNLGEKLRRMEEKHKQESDEKKEEIKKIKLNISLAELELKDLQETGKRSKKI